MRDYKFYKEEQYYIDLYDLHTVKTCLDYYWSLKDKFVKERAKFKEYSDEKFDHEVKEIELN